MTSPSRRQPSWTTPPDVVAALRRRWSAGTVLADYASGRPWQPLGVPLKGPTADQLSADFSNVRSWVRRWHDAPGGLRLEHRNVGGRLAGVNQVPARAWVDGYDQLWALLGVRDDVATFDALLEGTRRRAPRLAGWVAEHPRRVLEHRARWDDLVSTVSWIGARVQPGMYLRQVDVPGVDTKFIEGHRGVLADLLERELPAERIDVTAQRSDFARRYGFCAKPVYVRVRALDRRARLLPSCSELALRVDELAVTPPPASTVILVENEITYLALPAMPDTVALWVGGYAVTSLAALGWLHQRDVLYWGDVDTHGFAILDQLRGCFPRARSLLMDRPTLFAHEDQWVQEPSPIVTRLARLEPPEAALYRDLVQDSFGTSVRLEQERIGFGLVSQALERAVAAPGPSSRPAAALGGAGCHASPGRAAAGASVVSHRPQDTGWPQDTEDPEDAPRWLV